MTDPAAGLPPPVMTARLAATMLVLDAFVVFFATLVASVLVPAGHTVGQVWTVGLTLALLCALASGLVRRPGGIAVGTLLQVAVLATGLWEPEMYAVGAVFALLWAWLVSIGRRIDRDRRRWIAQARGEAGPG